MSRKRPDIPQRRSALGTQARALAETASGLRFSIEAAWAARSDTSSDVFGAAYPYANRLQVIEAFAERTFLRMEGCSASGPAAFEPRSASPAEAITTIWDFIAHRSSDTTGATRSRTTEHGVDVVAGVPRLSVGSAPACQPTSATRCGARRWISSCAGRSYE